MKEELHSLAKIRVIGPFSKTEHHLVWRDKRVVFKGFFGLPPGVAVERVKIGAFSFEEMGAFGRSVFPGQPVVIVFENRTPDPQSLLDASLALEVNDVVSVDKPSREGAPEPKAREGSALLHYTLVFGGGQARVGFRVKDLSTFEEVWTNNTCSLAEVNVMGTIFSGPSLNEWRGMVLTPHTPVELVFTPKGTDSRARAVVRMEKLNFPKAGY